MLLHIFRHVQADHGAAAAVDLLGQGTAQLRLAHAGGAGKEQAGNGPLLVPQPGKAPAHRLCHGTHRLTLAHHMGLQQGFQVQQPLSLRGGEPSHRDARAGGNHPGNVRGRHRTGAAVLPRLCHHGLHFVPQLRRLLKAALPHGLMQLLLQLPAGRTAPGQAKLLHPGPGRTLIQQIDGLVGKKKVRQIPHGQAHRLL